ncbi:hypothetical protein ACFX1S_025818 [Malus domestica]
MGLSVLDNMEISMVHVLPADFQSSTTQPNFLDGDVFAEEAGHIDFVHIAEVESITKDDSLKAALAELFPRSSSAKLHHLKPLYVTAYIEGYPVSKVFVDCGATVNIMHVNIMKALRRSNDELIPSGITMSSFVGDKSQTKGVLPLAVNITGRTHMTAFFIIDSKTEYSALLVLVFWDGKSVTVHPADSQPFEVNMIQARYYDDHVGYITIQGFNDEGRLTRISVQKAIEVDAETVHQDSTKLGLANFLPDPDFLAEGDNGPVLSPDKIQAAPAEREDNRPQVKDPLEEINVGTADDPRPLFISALLPQPMKDELRALFEEFKDCFAWSYREMHGLDRTLVEHELRIKPGCKPFRQPPRRFSTEKNGALRICIDFRNLNLATPKYEYTMSISDLLIDAAANHAILSFMDGHAGYNQIFITEADVHKTAFRCPGALGTYEWVVMPFGLKNAGATYQQAMNTIFHDLIGTIVEVYIDDVVIKSKQR